MVSLAASSDFIEIACKNCYMDYRAVHAKNFIVFGHNSTARATTDIFDTVYSVAWMVIAGALVKKKFCDNPVPSVSALRGNPCSNFATQFQENLRRPLNSPWSNCSSWTRFLIAHAINVVKFCSEQTPSNSVFWVYVTEQGCTANLYVYRIPSLNSKRLSPC